MDGFPDSGDAVRSCVYDDTPRTGDDADYTFIKGVDDGTDTELQTLNQHSRGEWGDNWCGPTAAGISLGWFAETNPEEFGNLIPVPPPPSQQFGAVLEGSQEVPALDVDGMGFGFFQLQQDGSALEYNISVDIASLTGPITGAHFHLDPPGPAPALFGAPIGTSVIETTFQQNLPGPTAAGDFNEDGILDVVVTSGGEDIHIMLGNDDGQGNGDGSFTQNDIRYPGEVPGPVKVGDVDNDGHLDIAWSSANGLTVVTGDGNGGFGPANHYPVFVGMRTVGLGDLNGDGYLDLLGGNCCGSSVAYLLNSGDAAPGMFGLVQSLGEPHLAGNPARGQIEVVDLNGDGELDVLISNQGPNISVMLANAGDDGFTRSQLVDNKGSSANGLAVGDFNGDNIPDLVSNHLISGDNVFLGIGDGTFGPATTYPTDSCLPNPFALAVAAVDLDGDGNLDIATTNVNCDNISVLMGDGAGSFSPAANFPDPLDTSVINALGALVADDFNGDGKIDLLTTAAHSRKVAVMFGVGWQ